MTWSPPPHDPNKELRDHLPLPGWRSAVTIICARHGIDASTARSFPTGSDVVWSAGETVVKLTAPCWTGEIEAETHWLRRVTGRLRVATPAVLATGELSGWPYVVMSRVPGRALGEVWPDLDHEERRRLARDLGTVVRQLHGLDPSPETPRGLDGDAWDPFWSACRSNVTERHRVDGVPPELALAIDGFLADVGALADTPRVLLHTEVLDQHVLATERDGRWELSGLIDFADGRIGPAEYEFPAPVEFLFKGESGLLRAFLLAYGLEPQALTPERSRRMLAWGLSHRFGSLRRMLGALGAPAPGALDELAARLYCVV